MNRKDQFSTWVVVDLQAIEGNVRSTLALTRSSVMAVVKANGYGHGAVPVAQAAIRGGAAWLAVARIEEGFELREAGIQKPILLLGHIPISRYQEAIEAGISLTIWETTHLQAAAQAADEVGQPARLHLKVDTGMSRLGVQPQEAVGMARQIADQEHLVLEGLFSHLARADEVDGVSAAEQLRDFQSVVQGLEHVDCLPSVVHLANSAAALWWPDTHYNLVRLGIALYGLEPSKARRMPAQYQPALTWKSQLSQVKILPAGRGLSYGHIYRTSREERIGTVPVGYADGFRRIERNQVLVGGMRVPVVGRVCMDQILVQLDEVPTAKIGDEVVIIGEQDGNVISAEEVADRWGTINYEVTSMIGARVPRLYEG